MGTENAGHRDPLEVLEKALAGGISHFQLREKGPAALTGKALAEFALQCKKLCSEYGVPFIVNDDVELAHEIGADGVHVGQEDAAAGAVRRLIGKEKILGVSVHSLQEAQVAAESGADYVGMGPIFGTRSKNDAKSPSGVSGIMAVKSYFPNLPVIGIGGITPENAKLVWAAGAQGIAVISAIAQAENIPRQVERLKATYQSEVLK